MIVEVARAKLNLALHVRARRDDGYHDIETLFAFVEHGDTLRVAPAGVDSFIVSGPFAHELSDEGDNLVTRAMAMFRRDVVAVPPVAIELVKHLPVASGVGGGSADAAAALRACAALTGVDPRDAWVSEVADRLGSDVPACLLGRTAIGSGRGEALRPIEGLGGMPVLLVNPGVAVPTGPVFAAWDGVDRGQLASDDAWTIARDGRNDLSVPAKAIAPVIGEALDALDQLEGATLVRMSGSGATCFALFDSIDARAAGGRAIGSAYPGWWCIETALA